MPRPVLRLSSVRSDSARSGAFATAASAPSRAAYLQHSGSQLQTHLEHASFVPQAQVMAPTATGMSQMSRGSISPTPRDWTFPGWVESPACFASDMNSSGEAMLACANRQGLASRRSNGSFFSTGGGCLIR